MSTTLLQVDGVDFTDDFARKQMHRHGYFGDRIWPEVVGIDRKSHDWGFAIERCQEHRGLLIDGDLGGLTARSLMASWCGVPRTLARGGGSCQFPLGMGKIDRCEVTYSSDMSGVKGMSRERAEELVDLAAKRWSKVSGLHLRRVSEPIFANIVVEMWNLGPGLLGLAELSCGANAMSQLFCRLAKRVIWESDDNGDLCEVICHEKGHNIGFFHEDRQDSVMLTGATGIFWEPQPIDISRSIDRYEEDTYDGGTPPPLPPPPPPGGEINFAQTKVIADRNYKQGEGISLLVGIDRKAL